MHVILSAAKDPACTHIRFFAALRMTFSIVAKTDCRWISISASIALHPLRYAQQLIDRLPHIEAVVLAVLAIGTAGTLGFIKLADEVLEGDTESFDQWAVQALRDPANPSDPIGPRWLEEMGRDATALGGIGWLTFTTLVVAGFLFLIGKARMALFMTGAAFSGAVISFLLKHIYSRPRPDLVPHLSIVSTSSFPSGHSMLSAVVYLTLGSLLASVLPDAKLKIYVLAVAAMLTFFVGVSRVYLGVHYPTDVLAGWLAGLVWALVCWLVARWLQVHGGLEKSSAEGNRR
jgi:undecaprenyl-diphosphatase